MRVFFKSFARKTAYAIAILVIFIASLVAISRILTPILDDHRADFEKFASELLKAPVKIDNVRVSWYRYEPEIRLSQVTIIKQDSQQPLLQIQKVRIFFSIPQSIWQWKIVPSGIMISGADITVHQTATGEYDVQGYPITGFSAQPYKNETKFSDAILWVAAQPRLILRDIDVRYTGFNGQRRYVTLFDLVIKNAGIDHFVYGKAILHQEIPTEVAIAVNVHGNEPDLQKIKVKAYLYVSGLSLSQWLKGSTWNNWQLNEGMLSTKIWFTWNHGELRKFQSTFQLYGIDLYSQTDKSTHMINRLSGNLGWKKDGNVNVFAGDDILLDLPNHLWPATNFYLALTPNAQGQLIPKAANVGYVDITDLQSFVFSSPPIISTTAKKMLVELKPSGALINATAAFTGAWTDWSKVSLSANFSNLSFSPWQQLPGINNLTGLFKWNGVQGDLSLNSHHATIVYESLFAKPITAEQLTGDAAWQLAPTGEWTLTIPALQILNSDLAANLKGNIRFPVTGSPVANLQANFTMQKINHISHYVPARVMDKDLIAWLRQAFVAGEIQSGHAVIEGPLNELPFDKANGKFEVTAKIDNLDFSYAPNWPRLQHATSTLLFVGRKVEVNILQGQLLDIPVKNIHGLIPYLGAAQPQFLQFDLPLLSDDFSQTLRFVRTSPLQKTIGKMFENVDLHGPMTLKLNFNMPLRHPDRMVLNGEIDIKHDAMDLVPWGLSLKNIEGIVHFTDKSTNAKNLHALLFGKPLTLSIDTIDQSKDISIVRATVATNLSVMDLETWLKIPFTKIVKGAAEFNGDLDFSLKQPAEIHLRSDLDGITVNAENDYAKAANVKRHFTTDIKIEEKHPLQVKLSYGDLLGAALLLDKTNDKMGVIGANLHLGAGKVDLPPANGLYITGDLAEINWDKIKPYLNNNTGQTNLAGLQLHNIDVNAKEVNLFGQHLTQARLQVTPAANQWNITITSPQVSGQIQLPANMSAQGVINAQFQRLALSTSTDATTMNVDVKSLPAITLTANSFSYNNMEFGQVTLKTIPSEDGLMIKTLRLSSARMNLQAMGDWVQSGTTETTHIQGNATSPVVNDLLTKLGYNMHNFIASDGKVAFKLSWPAAPYTPAMAILNGRASLYIGKGRIVDVGQASGAKMDIGRMLSLFSLQSLPRRLALDFSDVTQSGYSFDSLSGDFTFENGDLYTTNAAFDGPLARVSVIGRIGLKNKDFDCTLGISPINVTSGIPIAATILTGPVGGLAALAVNTVISPAVSQATTYYYAIRGPWGNPTWKEISVPRKNNRR